MTEQELILALRELIAKASADALDSRLLAREISRSDQQRIRLLVGLSVFFWLLAAAGLVLLCIGLDSFVLGVRLSSSVQQQISDMQKQARKQAGDKEQPNSKAPSPHLTVRELEERGLRWRRDGTQLLHHSIWYVAGSVGALFMAALCTVLLVTTSRRATLRQINLSLMELAEQVRQLRSVNSLEKIRKPEST